jgi:hypothetical protein
MLLLGDAWQNSLAREVYKYFTLKYFTPEPKPAARGQKIGGGGAPMPRSRRRRRVEKIGSSGAAGAEL